MRRPLLLLTAALAAACSKGTPTETPAGPATALVSTPEAVSGPEVSFAFVASAPGATFACSLDGAAAAACTSPHALRGLASGAHSFTAVASSAAGVADPAPPTFAWTVDAAPPATTISAHPAASSSTAAASFAFTSSKPGGSFRCFLDGAGPEACTSPRSYSLADGAHDFSVQAVDALGNADPAAPHFAWTISTAAAPATAFSATPPAISGASATFAFVASAPDATFLCSLDGAAPQACTSPLGLTGLASGTHTLTVAATSGGRTDATPASFTWTADATPPTTTLTAQPPAVSTNATAAFSFASNERPATFLCTIDGAGPSACTSPRIATLSIGAHVFTVAAVDQAGNVDPAPPTVAFTIAGATPAATAAAAISNGPSNPSSATTASFWFSGTPSGATFSCVLDGAAAAPCTSPKQYVGLSQGSHTFSVTAAIGGVAQSSPPSYTWVIDGVPPQTLITDKPAALTNVAAPTFTFASSKPPSSFACRIDQGALFACTSPFTSAALADGAHTFLVVATDAAGNLDPYPPTASWTQDTVAPDTALSAAPANPTNATAATFQFSATKATSGFVCSLDGAPFAPCASPDARTVADGPHTYAVAAVDLAGNRDPSPASHPWTVDRAAPVATLTGALPAALTRLSSASFSFTSDKAGSTFRCTLDGATAVCTSPASYAGLSSAAHAFAVVAVDAAGNTSAPAGHAWTVDLVAPSASITAAPGSPSNVTSPSFSFTASEAGSTFACALDGAAAAPCASPKLYAGLAAGAHTFSVVATDPAGNDSAPASRTWTLDTAAPVATITARPALLSNQRGPSFSFSSSKPGGAFTCALDGGAASACTSPKAYAHLADGAHSFAVVAIDLAGNSSAPASASWTIDSVLPIATLGAGGRPAPITNHTDATFTFTADKAGSSFACVLDGVSSACTSPVTYAGLGSVFHSFSAIAIDPAGNQSAPAGYSWTVDTTAPTATLTARPDSPSRVAAPSFSFVADEPGSTFTCSVDGAPALACTSPASTGALADGPHSFAVVATDPAGNPSSPASFGWTVDTQAPQPPTGLAATAGNRSLAVSWAPVADAASYSVLYGVPPGASRLDGLTGTSAALSELDNCAAYGVSVIAVDAAGNESAPADAVTATPSLPAPTAAASGSAGVISLTWSTVENADGYRVYYGATKGGPYVGANALDGSSPLSRTGSETTLNGLPPFDATYVRVAAVDGACEGPKSDEVLSTPVPWRSLNPLPTDKTLRAISCAPGGLPCAAVGDSGVALSSADGTGWSRAYSATTGAYTAVQMASATVGFAISGTDVYKSTTAGSAWVKAGAISPTRSIFALSFASASTGLVASAAGVVLKTTDGGATWTAIDTGTLASWLGVWLSPDAQTAVVVGQSGVIRQSVDGGATWANRSSGVSADLNAVWCGSTGACFAAGAGGAITASTNGGASWAPQTSGTAASLRGLAFATDLSGWAVGDSGALRATTDGGATWTAQASGETGALRGVAVGAGGAAFFVGDSGIVRKTTDGATWVSHRTVLTAAQLNRVATFGDAGVLAVGNGGVVLRSLDGAATWTTATPTSANLNGLWFASDTTAWAVGASGTILKTSDAGATWTAQTSNVTVALNDVHCLDALTCFAVGRTSVVATTNGGATWTAKTIATGSPGDLVSVRFADLDHGFVGVGYEGGGNPTNFLRTIDGGVFWQSSPLDVSGHGSNGGYGGVYAIYAADALHLTMTANSAAWGQGSIATSNDGGATWQRVTGGGPTFRGLAVKAGVYAATQNDAVWLSSDGINWGPTPTGSTGALRSVAIANATTFYAVGDGGAIYKTVTGGK